MKNKDILPVALLGVGVVALTASAIYAFTNVAGKIFRKRATCGSRFLFIGDSNTVPSFSYADLLKRDCPDATVVKIAEVSKNTSWMLEQLRNALNQSKYDVVVILGGSNDLGNPNQEPTYRNLDTMYRMAKDSGAMVVAVTPPNKDFKWSEGLPNEYPVGIERLDRLVDYIAWNQNKDVFIDYNKITGRKDYFAADMQHGNANAHKALYEEFKKKVL